jgi:nucleoside-triphosphatase THEP1
MKQAYLLTGPPGVGKTTLIKEAISALEQRVGGFYTREIRKQGIRQGFEIMTLDGASAILASVDFHGPHRVSKYGVMVDNLDSVGVAALRRAVKECDIVVVDEIGKMELFSSAFKETVMEALDSGKILLGTIMLAPHPWADRIKQDRRVEVVMVSRANHQQVGQKLQAWLKGD